MRSHQTHFDEFKKTSRSGNGARMKSSLLNRQDGKRCSRTLEQCDTGNMASENEEQDFKF